MFLVRPKAFGPSANRHTNQAPKSASNVLPAAMVDAVATDPCVTKLTNKAPRKTPGASRYPHKRTAAKAMPLGGQTAEALGFMEANDNPKLPAQK
jgi:hypothetical protein